MKKKYKMVKKYNEPIDYIIDEKLDGIFCLIVYNNKEIKIYTRDNGTEGQDISHIKTLIKGVSDIKDINITVRDELIISRKD